MPQLPIPPNRLAPQYGLLSAATANSHSVVNVAQPNSNVAQQIKDVLTKLGVEPEVLVRKGEEIYKTEYKGKALTYDQWIEAFVKHPVLIERPIIIKGDKAVIGRPIENIDTLLD